MTAGAVMAARVAPVGLPVALASAQRPNVMTIANGDVFWASTAAGAVWRVALSAGSSPTQIRNATAPTGVAYAGYPYWTTQGTIRFEGSGCGAAACYAVDNLVAPRLLVVDSARFYFLTDASGGSLQTCLAASCSNATVQTVASSLAMAEALIVTNGTAYVALETSVVAIDTASSQPATPVPIAQGLPRPWGLATDSVYVYFTCLNDGSVRRARRFGGNGTSEVLATGLVTPKGVAVDSTHVYATSGGDGRVVRFAHR